MKGGNKLRFYKTFKLFFCREPYLDSILDFTLRKIITKFRCSDHCLEIEKDRHIKLKPEERICKLCKSDIETELHFIQDCPACSDIRSHFLEIIPHITGPKFCNARIRKVRSILQIF